MTTQLLLVSAGSGLESLSLAMAGGVNIDLDRSVIVQIVLFTFLIVVLKPLLFDPILKVFALREERTEGARAAARELQEKAGELLRRYEHELERVHRVAAEERDRLRAETAQLEAEILREARKTTARIVDDGRRKIETEVNAIRFELGKESERVAQAIVTRLVQGGTQ
jgi:F-type H+-transporting ATPase subunit b